MLLRTSCIRLCLCLLFTLWGGFVHGQTVEEDTFPAFEVVADAPARIEVGVHMGVLVDPSGTLTLEQAMSARQPWETIQRQSPNFGFTSDTYWFRFQIRNATDQVVQRLIELPVPFIDDLRLYHFVGGALKTEYALGDEKPFQERVLVHRNFVMPVQLAPGSNVVYLRMASAGTIEAPLRIWESEAFHASSNDENLVQGGVVGILLVMVIYNLFIYFSTRDTNYLYYIGFVTSYLFFHFTLTGYTFAYVWPQAVRWNSFAISVFIASSALFTCLFANSFLRLRNFSHIAFRFVQFLQVCCGMLLVLTFFVPYSVSIRIGAVITMPVAITALSLGYWRWWRGATFARFYCLAWTAVLVGISALNASKLGWIPVTSWTENASQIGIVMLVVLLSFTLADRINRDRMLRMDAQAMALEQERKLRESQLALMDATAAANRDLEQKVQARTAELHATMARLTLANDSLQQLSHTDGLTQLHNRAFFDEALATEHRRAVRQGTALTVVLLDIDHFKQINDIYGHLAGDACLRALAQRMRLRVERAGDILARYGGEEFVVVLIGNDLQGALAFAEMACIDIEGLEVVFGGQSICFTASFGVAHGVPAVHSSPQDLLAAADRALYEAKHAGRNCVRHEVLWAADGLPASGVTSPD